MSNPASPVPGNMLPLPQLLFVAVVGVHSDVVAPIAAAGVRTTAVDVISIDSSRKVSISMLHDDSVGGALRHVGVLLDQLDDVQFRFVLLLAPVDVVLELHIDCHGGRLLVQLVQKGGSEWTGTGLRSLVGGKLWRRIFFERW